MINNILVNEINKHNPSNITEIKNAMKEVLQNIILVGLGKSDFFNNAVFYGGTSLRIFRNLPRFSEDLDFTLQDKNTGCDFDGCLLFAKRELESHNIACEIYNKEKNIDTTVDTRYFRFNLKNIFGICFPNYSNQIISNELLTIKTELEKNTFLGGITEIEKHGLKIGEDISIVGYDGIKLSRLLRPILTTFVQDSAEIGRRSTKKLVETIENPNTVLPERIIVKGYLQEGKTVKNLNN